ncbi:MAG: pyrroloquinoline quinone biosynthesis protein PqqB [Rhodospirillales bacterium]|nr:pyrroloquinoline quinone biosynthesis protein PqqB [Rhodospirillales bacterium]
MEDDAAGLSAIVLGAAAGGGFPQWNCGCRLCRLARAGDPRVRPATQASVALSGNGAEWVIVGASPDLRQQILRTPQLWPGAGLRHSPIVAVVLLGADIDAIAGLLTLRERQPFTVYAAPPILTNLRDNPIFGVLDPAIVTLRPFAAGQTLACGAGLELTLLEMPGKLPLYRETPGATIAEPGEGYAARLSAYGRSTLIAPACAQVSLPVRRWLEDVDLVFFDGTLFTDDEMIVAGLGHKTGRRMGHLPISGAGGTLEALSGLAARRILLHINNSNPILLAGSPERRLVEAAGFEIAYDGMEVRA